ncbi:CAMK family protein kinase [Histomonas meleagridis]|uniref:CAMK family protein kinase n=1 Tax=Histomonas meleagridis TaxID=135588 RepID=UPI0035598A3E|nr:CAMK family protein kinase [Histomonas meleagridis]KAH0806575.1 CAMK family protein kinase [Histomonas meleagridis]
MLANANQQISLVEIQKILPEHHYHFKKTIGAGGYGTVFLVRSEKYNQDFCVKRISQPETAYDETKNEATTLFGLCHPNIISMYEFFFDESYTNLYIVLEYCRGGSLKDVIEKEGPIHPPKLYSICYHIIKALLHCHEQNVAHRDIKPANILLDNYGRPKLADFGLSKKLERGEKDNSYAGSHPYMAPEIINRQKVDPFLADIWSLGITFYTIAFGRLPWLVHTKDELNIAISIGNFAFPSYADSRFCLLIRSMTAVDPAKRAPLSKLLRSPLFDDIHKFSYTTLYPSNKREPVGNSMSLRSKGLSPTVSFGKIRIEKNNVRTCSVGKTSSRRGPLVQKTFAPNV